MKNPSYELIVAAIGGDAQAMEAILQHYEPMINEQCGGDEDMREEIILALIDAIQHFDLNDPAKNEEYLKSHCSDQGRERYCAYPGRFHGHGEPADGPRSTTLAEK